MNHALVYSRLADAVLVLHVGVVAFVVGGLVAIVLGRVRRWRWSDALGFRVAHLLAIGVVVAEAWFDVVCPLTTLEAALRARAHEATYGGSFIGHWLQRLIFYDAPPAVFTAAYSLFGLAVIASWWFFPPRRHHDA
ncbi:MAG: DUF2784 domain-containing protein [Caldimonas sp.]